MLTLVVIIAAWEIWSVLKDIRKALQTEERVDALSAGALSAVGEKLDAVVGELDRIGNILARPGREPAPGCGVVDQLDRIGGILGGMLASMPSPPREHEAWSDWDKLRAQLGVKNPDAK
jgi:hypothetical protein